MVLSDTQVDGRRLRREQNREAVIDALVALFEDGSYTPSSNEIAERAGISPRSLFRYFDDVDDLNRAAIERHIGMHRDLFDADVDPAAPTAEKIERFVSARARLHAAAAPGARAARLTAHRRAVIASQLRETRDFLRTQVETIFARELEGRSEVLPAIDVLCSFESYEYMRYAQSLPEAKTRAALTAALRALLLPGRS